MGTNHALLLVEDEEDEWDWFEYNHFSKREEIPAVNPTATGFLMSIAPQRDRSGVVFFASMSVFLED